MTPDLIRALTGSASTPELTFRRVYRATVEEVRGACTEPGRLARWLGVIEGEPAAVGDAFSVQLGTDPDDRAACSVLHCEPDRIAISWSWQDEAPSVVGARWREVADGGVEFVLTHRLAEPEHTSSYGGGWERLLQGLARSVDDAEPGSLPDEAIEAGAIERWRTMAQTPLSLHRHISAPRERVWAAIATAEGLRTWWWRHWDDVTITADVRVDGHYRISAPSAGITLGGTYLTVTDQEALAFTWRWQDDDGVTRDEAVEIRLEPDGAGTRVTVLHTGPWDDDVPAQNYRQGWEFTLGELDAVLGEDASTV